MADTPAPDDDPVDFALLAQRASQMRQQLERARADIGRLEARGLGGNGLVQATVSGEASLVGLSIDSSIIDPDDPETLQEFVREAVNDAMAKLAAQRGEHLGSITKGFAAMASGVRGREPLITPLTPNRRQPPRPGSES